MMIHLLRIIAAIAFIILCTLLPFLPGPYDPLAAPLSLMTQLFGKVGLVLVPVGALGMISESRSRTARKRSLFAITALIASSVVWLFVSLGAFLESLALGAGVLLLGAYVVSRLLPRLRPPASTTPARTAIPLYLMIVPVAVTTIQLAIARPVSEFTRSRAIRNSAPMIADIEQYRARNGHYPVSLIAVQKDYSPSIIGIRQYLYEPSGDAYNVLFEQSSFQLGTREIVMYNPRNQHAMTSHTMDRLQLTPEQLALDQTRGHNAVHDAPQPNWRYFLFD